MRLPKKPGPQEWTDVVLPIFDQPEEKQERTLSRKEEEDNRTKLAYRPYKGASRMCEDCFVQVERKERDTFGRAAFIRIEGLAQRYICYEHKALRTEAEAKVRKPGDK